MESIHLYCLQIDNKDIKSSGPWTYIWCLHFWFWISICLLKNCKNTKAALETCSRKNNTGTSPVIIYITQISYLLTFKRLLFVCLFCFVLQNYPFYPYQRSMYTESTHTYVYTYISYTIIHVYIYNKEETNK